MNIFSHRAYLWLVRAPLRNRSIASWKIYSYATLITIAALGPSLAILAYYKTPHLFFFFSAIAVVGILFGRNTALYATFLSVLLNMLLILPYLTSPMKQVDIIGFAAFTVSGIVIAAMTEISHAGYIGVADSEQRLAARAQMRDLLLREISHRERNDLAVLSTALSLQSLTIKSQEARKALADAAERLRIMARIQTRLDMNAGGAVVDSKMYFNELCDDLRTALLAARSVRLTVHAESHPLTHEQAVALGLITNELLTNAIKHGFPERREGQIDVRFERAGADCCLVVRDDGVGMSATGAGGAGMGLNLSRMLAHELGGSLAVVPSEKGVHVTVTLPVAEPQQQSAAALRV